MVDKTPRLPFCEQCGKIIIQTDPGRLEAAFLTNRLTGQVMVVHEVCADIKIYTDTQQHHLDSVRA